MHDGFFLHIALFNTLIYMGDTHLDSKNGVTKKINFLYLQMARHA